MNKAFKDAFKVEMHLPWPRSPRDGVGAVFQGGIRVFLKGPLTPFQG